MLPIQAGMGRPGRAADRIDLGRLPVSRIWPRASGATVVIADALTAPELDDPSRSAAGDHAHRSRGARRSRHPDPGVRSHDRSFYPAPGRGGCVDWRRGLPGGGCRAGGRTRPQHCTGSCGRTSAGSRSKGRFLKAAQALTSDLRFEAVIQRLVDEVVQIFRADAADCWIFDEDRRLLQLPSRYRRARAKRGPQILPEGNFKEVIETGQPLLKASLQRPRSRRRAPTTRSLPRCSTLPSRGWGKPVGFWASARSRKAISSPPISSCWTRCADWPRSLHNVESFEERERQAQVQRGFYKIAEVLGSTLSLSETVDALARPVRALGGSAAVVPAPHGDHLQSPGRTTCLRGCFRGARGRTARRRLPVCLGCPGGTDPHGERAGRRRPLRGGPSQCPARHRL